MMGAGVRVIKRMRGMLQNLKLEVNADWIRCQNHNIKSGSKEKRW